MAFVTDHADSARDAQLEFELRSRTESDREEAEQLAVAAPATSLRDVGTDRQGRSPHLLAKSVTFLPRKATYHRMD